MQGEETDKANILIRFEDFFGGVFVVVVVLLLLLLWGFFVLFILNHESDEQVPGETVEPLSTETFKTPLDCSPS